MPDWDQWDAEAMECLVPWFTHDEFLRHLFAPHNEHRIVLTKLQNLALALLNGQWDARLQSVTNAVLHSALAAAFWLLGHRVLRRARATSPSPSVPVSSPALQAFLSAALFLLAFALFGLPLAFQNVLGGFHSQQYWLAGLAFVTLVTLPFARPWSARWWVGAVSGILGLGTMGSGFIAASCVVVVLLWRVFQKDTSWREAAPAFCIGFIVTAIGVLTREEVPGHAEFKAKTVHDFAFTIIHSLQWPWRDQHWAALVLWLPWLLLAWRLLRSRERASRTKPGASSLHTQLILALGGWVIVQLIATAYARGAGADYPASRYMDTLTFGTMVNAIALGYLWVSHERTTRSRMLPLLACVWIVTLATGAYRFLSNVVRIELDGAKRYYIAAEANMRRYLATNDPKHFANPDIPYPSADGLVERLAIPSLRALMPIPLRAPLPISAARGSPPGMLPFVENNAVDADAARPPRNGLSPLTPPLDYTKTWGSFDADNPSAPREWKSGPIDPTPFHWLKFETAGQLGTPGGELELELRDATSGALLDHVRPSRVPGDAWRSAYVRMPDRRFTIVARDRASSQWLAFSPPVEMAWLSYWAWQATKHAMLLFWSVGGLTVIVCLLALKSRPTSAE